MWALTGISFGKKDILFSKGLGNLQKNPDQANLLAPTKSPQVDEFDFCAWPELLVANFFQLIEKCWKGREI